MRKCLFSILLIFATLSTYASHFMGGQLRTERQSDGTYKIVLEIYNDLSPSAIGLLNAELIVVWNYNVSNGTWDNFKTIYVDSAKFSTVIAGSVGIGRYENTIGSPTGQALPTGLYKITYDSHYNNGYRNASVNNILNSDNKYLALSTTFNVTAAPQVNTNPYFLASPLFIAKAGKPFDYNPVPSDKDGDSVQLFLTIPLNSIDQNATGVPIAWSPLPAGTTGAPGINAKTGAFTWTPPAQGRFQQAFVLKSYRNGLAIDSFIQDMQFLVLPGADLPDVFPISGNVKYDTAGKYHYVYYKPDTAVTFQVVADNSIGTDSSFVSSHSGLYQTGSSAVFTTTRLVANQQIGTFSWTPPAGTRADKIVVFRGRTVNGGNDLSVVLRKEPKPAAPDTTVSVSQTAVSSSLFSVVPNPVRGPLRVQLNLAASALVEITVTNMAGQVQVAYQDKLPAGTSAWAPEGLLPAGTYIITFKEAGKVAGSQLVLVP